MKLTGQCEVSTSDDGQVVISFMNDDGTYDYFKMSTQDAMRLAGQIDFHARGGPEFLRKQSQR